MTTLYFAQDHYGRSGEMRLCKGDCTRIRQARTVDGELKTVRCPNRNVMGLEIDNSEGEYGAIFICLDCLNELLEEIPDYIPGFMIDEGT